MDKFFLVSFLGLLIAAQSVAGNMIYDNIGVLEELESLDFEEENEVEASPIPSWTSERGSKVLVNVDSFGAAGDGVSDDTQVNKCVPLEIFVALRCSLVKLHFSPSLYFNRKSAWKTFYNPIIHLI